MKSRLLNLLPNVRWVPHDMAGPQHESGRQGKPRMRFKLRASSHDQVQVAAAAAEERNRRCRLSLRFEGDEEVDGRMVGQGQSLFFARLPLELRREVYAFVMGEGTVHFALGAKRRLGHFLCGEEEGGEGEEGGGGGGECGCRVLGGGRESGRLGRGGLSLIMACRRMYSEAVPYLYRSHTFSLLHVSHLLHLPAAIPQPRLDQIRTLRLRWAIRALPYLRRGPSDRIAYREDTAMWERGWAILAGMQGLRDLYVAIVDPSPQDMWERNWLELEELLLAPVSKVTKPRWFELVLPYASCGVGWDMGESRVVLRRRDGEDGQEDEDEDHV